ncbi:YopX family protein [Lysinibacillus sp. FSL M8-0337]|uniref:YopX family protein n=1 Tax=Lysinibacillus TaxID=400634 RepID=UPI00084A954E|nr:YopX family protein [Lysinibacillus sphaericus]
MREIKFKAFVNNRIHGVGVYPVGSINFYPFTCQVDIDGELISFFDFDNLKLIQFTGLKDKNGKEIYEGDIIKYSFRDGNDINTRFMQIYNDGVNFKMKELYRDYWLEKVDGVLKIKHGHLTKYRGETNLLCDVSALVIYWYEVIGNIYENPKLLGGDSQ